MDYTRILNELKEASLFDLFRLNAAISLLMDDPQRLQLIKRKLKINSQVTYFDKVANKLIPATILEIRRTTVLLSNYPDGKQWVIPLYMLNIDSVNTDIHKPANQKIGINKTQLKIGDMVGFTDQNNVDQYGEVIRLNQKTATIMINGRSQWRVSYKLLFAVMDGTKSYHNNETSLQTLLNLKQV